MNSAWTISVVICLGQKEVRGILTSVKDVFKIQLIRRCVEKSHRTPNTDGVSSMESRYIGCYKTVDSFVSDTYFQNNSGDACVRHCFPNYRYAGVGISVCYCGSELKGKQVDDTKCDAECLDPLFNGSCGSHKDGIISVYTIEDDVNVTINQSSYLNQRTEGSAASTDTPYSKTNAMDKNKTISENAIPETYTRTALPVCVLICFLVMLTLMAIKNVTQFAYKTCRRTNKGNKEHPVSYGYISPVNVIELDYVVKHDSRPVMDVKVDDIGSTSSNKYEYVDGNTTERQYSELV